MLGCRPDFSEFHKEEDVNDMSKIDAAPIPAVYACIAAVQADMAKEGISKDRSNQQQKYRFRGIDDVYNAIAPMLAKHKLCVLPRMISRDVTERKTANGGNLFYVTVEAEFDFVAAVDGSCHVVRTFGEAMDSADKATNKAMSAAYKYAAFMAFAIPTEGDNDADATTHTVAPREAEAPAEAGVPADEWAKLVSLMKATGSQPGPMCKHFGVKSLRLLNQQQYGDAIERLSNKLAQMAKADTNKQADTQPEITDADIPY